MEEDKKETFILKFESEWNKSIIIDTVRKATIIYVDEKGNELWREII